ncbi:MAG: ABC transporter substrate-binding protein, partial [Myxococcales bacterium]|nr:ABC transporter substrate-binding protein [Myxococcales bacterium]
MTRTALHLSILTLTLLAAACTSSTAPVGATLLVGRPTDAIGLDPARVTDAESAETCEQIYDHLVRSAPGSLEIEPALAERWTVSEDGTEWIFHLRKDVLFHDGTRCDADAVIFSLDRQRDPRHPYHRQDFPYEPMLRNIVLLEKQGDFTVRMVIERAYAPFLANLSMSAASIVSPAAVKLWGDDFPFHPVGTGPFRFVEWSRGERITLAKNPRYFEGPPRIANLVFVAVRDPRQRLVALEGGSIDVAERLAPEDLQFVTLHPELKIERAAGNNVSYIAMNTEHPPFDDPRVRIAVNHAINKTPIVKLVFQGMALPARGALAPSSWAYIALPEYRYDPALARKLLGEAHYPRPTAPGAAAIPLKLYVMSTPRPYLPAPEQVARIVARNLRDVGIPVEVVVNPMAAHLRTIENGEHDLCIVGWSGDNGDPDNFLYGLFDSDNAVRGHARNFSFFRDAQLHGVLRWAQETQDRAQRIAHYAKAQRIIADSAPFVPLAHAEILIAHRRDVAGLRLDP